MCGIVGIINFEPGSKVAIETLKVMADIIKHRGPDDDGYFIKDNIGLGIRRLSIIDLQKGHQPISNEDQTIFVVLNGEIYNYIELRKELLDKGHKFSTQSDTEVIVHLYEEYGEDFVRYLRGMFSIALWDDRKKKILIARDRMGIKPLYYTYDDKAFYFASEIKSLFMNDGIKREVNLGVLDIFMSAGSVHSSGETMFSGIKFLQPGDMIIIQGHNVNTKKYWDMDFSETSQFKQLEEGDILEKLDFLLNESVGIHLRSDVPVGCFLSGGIDSATMTALMSKICQRKIKTFTVGYDIMGREDETQKARALAEYIGTEHYETRINSSDWWNHLPRYIWSMDEPVCNVSQVTFHYVCALARQHVKVVLSGLGGDELFVGYGRHFTLRDLVEKKYTEIYSDIYKLIEPLLPLFRDRHLIGKLINELSKKDAGTKSLDNMFWWAYSTPVNFTGIEKNILYRNPAISNYTNSPAFYSSIIKDSGNINIKNLIMYFDFKTWLTSDGLLSSDKVSMGNSLELRVPFFDHKLVEFVSKIPEKIRWQGEKHLLRKVMEKSLPDSSTKAPKQAWSTPIGLWMLHDWKEKIKEVLFDNVTLNRGYFDKIVLKRKVNNHFSRAENNLNLLMRLVYFELWHRTFIDRKPESSI